MSTTDEQKAYEEAMRSWESAWTEEAADEGPTEAAFDEAKRSLWECVEELKKIANGTFFKSSNFEKKTFITLAADLRRALAYPDPEDPEKPTNADRAKGALREAFDEPKTQQAFAEFFEMVQAQHRQQGSTERTVTQQPLFAQAQNSTLPFELVPFQEPPRGEKPYVPWRVVASFKLDPQESGIIMRPHRIPLVPHVLVHWERP